MSSGAIMRLSEARRYLGDIHPTTMSRWIRRGLLRPIDGTRFITRAEVERFAGERQRGKSAEERKRGRYQK